jgi:hypothetical protein
VPPGSENTCTVVVDPAAGVVSAATSMLPSADIATCEPVKSMLPSSALVATLK